MTLPNGIVTGYSYDSASQLTAQTYTNGLSTLGNLAYGYDLRGRRVSDTGSYARTNLPPAVSTTAYNVDNQLTTWGTANLFYDANGNMMHRRFLVTKAYQDLAQDLGAVIRQEKSSFQSSNGLLIAHNRVNRKRGL